MGLECAVRPDQAEETLVARLGARRFVPQLWHIVREAPEHRAGCADGYKSRQHRLDIGRELLLVGHELRAGLAIGDPFPDLRRLARPCRTAAELLHEGWLAAQRRGHGARKWH